MVVLKLFYRKMKKKLKIIRWRCEKQIMQNQKKVKISQIILKNQAASNNQNESEEQIRDLLHKSGYQNNIIKAEFDRFIKNKQNQQKIAHSEGRIKY